MTLDATIYQPTIREIRGSSPLIVELGDCRISDDLEGLREFARDLTRRLDDLAEIRRLAQAQQALDRPTVELDPEHLTIGQDIFTNAHGWVQTTDNGRGTCHRWDIIAGDSEISTSRGTVFFAAGEKALVAVPDCEGSTMKEAS